MNLPDRRMSCAVLLIACACSLVFLSAQAGDEPRDETGATPLMQAAAFGTLGEVEALIHRGADVNATAADGATTLMWAAGEPSKLRLLLDRGAAVNAAAADGTTALVAAVHRGNRESMRLLIEAGADLKRPARELLQAAVVSSNPDVRRTLRDAGVAATHIGQVAPALGRIDRLDASLTRELVGIGLDPGIKLPFVTVQFPLLGYAAFTGDLEVTRVLIDAGADSNLETSRGVTPLMVAAASDRPNPGIVRMLLERGAHADARDDMGRSALDWALMQGNTQIARLLRDAGVPAGPALSPTPAAVDRPRPLGKAIGAGVATMDGIGPAFNDRTKCISCHNQSLPAMARQFSAARGLVMKPDIVAHPTRATLDVWRQQRSAYMVGRCGGGGFVQSVGYGLMSMAAEGAPRTPVTDAAVTCLASKQYPDGSWASADVRPPLGGSPVVWTALAMRSLDRYMPPGLRAHADRRIEDGRNFLLRAETHDTQEDAMKLLGLVWGRAPEAEVSNQALRLAALQRSDGGWGQVPTMASDAYATGQAMYALASSGVRTSDARYEHGVAYLLRTQLEDGSWFVRSRGFPFQPYFDYGFPHGTNQFISAAATSWAVIALAQ